MGDGGYSNPLTSLPADAITSGAFSGAYTVPGSILLAGAAGGSHIQAGGSALTFYAADGVTPLITMDTSSGAGSISSATITGGTIQTAAQGRRMVLSGSSGNTDTLSGYSGLANEVTPGSLTISAASGARSPGGGGQQAGGLAQLRAPDLGYGGLLGQLFLYSKDPNNPSNSQNLVGLQADLVQLARSAGGGAAKNIYARDDLIVGSGSITIASGQYGGSATFYWFADQHAHPLGAPAVVLFNANPITGNTDLVTGNGGGSSTSFTGRIEINGRVNASQQYVVPVQWVAIWG